jgi:hypothetical protein
MDVYAVLNDPIIETTPSFLGRLYWPYLTFNALEATAWIVIAIIIVVRMIRFGRSFWESAYAFSFLLFGLSDVIEIQGTTLLLLLFKLACLAAIFGIRPHSLTRHGGRVF